MHSDILLQAVNLSKTYKLYNNPKERLKEALHPLRKKYHRDFYALHDVSFDLKRGEAIGILGRNGSGKSTLLKIIAGVTTPSSGNVVINGKIAALLELGAGFNPEMTGLDNIFLSGTIMGLTHREIREQLPAILRFADIGSFISQPIKTYSSGMLVRLAFSLQTQVNPDILIIDEALAVGDALFQKRCFQRIRELMDKGTSLLFVSHDHELVNSLTNKAIFLSEGKVMSYGNTSDVVLCYRKFLNSMECQDVKNMTSTLNEKVDSLRTESENISPCASSNISPIYNDEKSYGDMDAYISDVTVLNANKTKQNLFYPNEKLLIKIKIRLCKTMEHLNVGLRILNKEGVKVYSWGTLNQDMVAWSLQDNKNRFWDKKFQCGDECELIFETFVNLGENLYEVQAILTEEKERYYVSQRILHWKDEAAFFSVKINRQEYFFGGIVDMKMAVSYE